MFIAPWLAGAAALLHDARFDPHERLELLERERVNVLCMAPTEYRVIAKRATPRPLADLRGMVAAGEALNPEVLRAWEEATGLQIRDGYGQTETGQLTGSPARRARPAGVDGAGAARGAARDRGRRARAGALQRCRPSSSATSASRCAASPRGRGRVALERARAAPRTARWHTGDRVRRDEDGWLYFEGRADDVIVSAGYRIGPVRGRVRARRPPGRGRGRCRGRPRRGARCGGARRGGAARRRRRSPTPELVRELQDHVKRETAPYKYPRIVDFAAELPKTASGKIKRAELRGPQHALSAPAR